MVKNKHRHVQTQESNTKSKQQSRKISTLLDFITIDVLKIEQQHFSDQDIITLPMISIIKISFNTHTISWELIHRRLLHPSYSVTKTMRHHLTMNVPPKHFSKKLNQALCTMCFTEKMTTFPKKQ